MVDKPAVVGLQDKDQIVHEGAQCPDGSTEFVCVVEVRSAWQGEVDFFGPFVHGAPGTRFLYVSWKTLASAPSPWLQRVKVPLTLTASEIEGATKVRADLTGRRPHARAPIQWTIIERMVPESGRPA